MKKQSFAACFTMLLFLNARTYAVRVREDTPLDNDRPPPGAHYCLDITETDSVCTPDPLRLWKTVLNQRSTDEINLGVAQRIDGTESEQNSIKAVLRLMNLYWYEEVLSNHEYESIRASW